MADSDLPDRTTDEWLHLARSLRWRPRRAADDVKDRSIREYRVAACSGHGYSTMSFDAERFWIMLNALPAAEGGPMTCIDDH